MLTPNIVEFNRLSDHFKIGKFDKKDSELQYYQQHIGKTIIFDMDTENVDESFKELCTPVVRLSQALNGATILKKGLCDIISNGKRCAIISTQGS